jgi:putative two-component system response regulator
LIRPCILIVDDDPVVQMSIEAILADQGYELHFASSGPEALQEARRLLPDVVLLDLMMPGMDGMEVCQKIRLEPVLAEVPILIVTAVHDHQVRLNGLQAGADDFLTKPIDRFELRARLQTITRLDRYRKLYLERTRLEQALADLRDAYDETIEGWTRAVDIRDKETEGHSQRVTALAIEVAQAAGVAEEQLRYMRWGSLLHDIGKLGIPDAILFKPGLLTPEERAVINRHPDMAFQMLSPIEYLQPALDIPYCHHEHWDGSGYPRGLKAEEIPLVARIFTIVDVWDALTSNRPYRSAWSREKACEYIRENAGIIFDPRLVGLFFQMIEKHDWFSFPAGSFQEEPGALVKPERSA